MLHSARMSAIMKATQKPSTTTWVLNGVFGGHIRPHNEKAKRVDRRLKEHQTGTPRVVVALRERTGHTLPFVAMTEGEGLALANENVSRMAAMSADEASHWDILHMGYNVDRVNHSEIYSDHGKHTNMVESFFSRLRNMIQGQHHGVSPKYLHQYANHSAWLEDMRARASFVTAGSDY
jgi:hypothetical protein